MEHTREERVCSKTEYYTNQNVCMWMKFAKPRNDTRKQYRYIMREFVTMATKKFATCRRSDISNVTLEEGSLQNLLEWF